MRGSFGRGVSTLVTQRDVFAESIGFSADSLTVRLDDGRALKILAGLLPEVARRNQAERENYELIGDGQGIHWPALDEDISVMGLWPVGRIGRVARQVAAEQAVLASTVRPMVANNSLSVVQMENC